MTAIIKPVGILKTYVDNQSELATEAGVSVRSTLKALGIPSEIVAMVLVDDEMQDKDYILKDGDLVKLIAIIGGG